MRMLVQTFIRHNVRFLMNFTSAPKDSCCCHVELFPYEFLIESLFLFLVSHTSERAWRRLRSEISEFHSIMLSKLCGKYRSIVCDGATRKVSKTSSNSLFWLLARSDTSSHNPASACLASCNDDNAVHCCCGALELTRVRCVWEDS